MALGFHVLCMKSRSTCAQANRPPHLEILRLLATRIPTPKIPTLNGKPANANERRKHLRKLAIQNYAYQKEKGERMESQQPLRSEDS